MLGSTSDDAVARYCAASEAGDMDAVMLTLAPDVELDSPISGHTTFRGLDDVGQLLTTVYSVLKDMRWTEQAGDGDVRMVIAEARVGPFALTDAMAFHLDAEGRISRIRPHLRPWLALTALAVALVPRMVTRHPGAFFRARFG